MKKFIIPSIIVVALLAFGFTYWLIGNSYPDLINPTESREEISNYSLEELQSKIKEYDDIQLHAKDMIANAIYLGWTSEDGLIKNLNSKVQKAEENKQPYVVRAEVVEAEQKALEEAKRAAEEEAAKKEREERLAKNAASRSLEGTTRPEAPVPQVAAGDYPVATTIWNYMKGLGWNDYVCAGIMGNMMTEAGGQTLNIQPTIMSPDGYYGICQWHRNYGIHGASLQQQLDFLASTIGKTFDTYGRNYQSGFNYQAFLNLTDARAAALAFSRCYERCSSASYGIRQTNAIKAYNYFVN